VAEIDLAQACAGGFMQQELTVPLKMKQLGCSISCSVLPILVAVVSPDSGLLPAPVEANRISILKTQPTTADDETLSAASWVSEGQENRYGCASPEPSDPSDDGPGSAEPTAITSANQAAMFKPILLPALTQERDKPTRKSIAELSR
jgi:hypothetical protein